MLRKAIIYVLGDGLGRIFTSVCDSQQGADYQFRDRQWKQFMVRVVGAGDFLTWEVLNVSILSEIK